MLQSPFRLPVGAMGDAGLPAVSTPLKVACNEDVKKERDRERERKCVVGGVFHRVLLCVCVSFLTLSFFLLKEELPAAAAVAINGVSGIPSRLSTPSSPSLSFRRLQKEQSASSSE